MNYYPLSIMNKHMQKKTTILIADDDSDIRKILHFILSNSGYAVIEAIDGNDAFKKLLVHDVDIVVSDVMMPGMSGLDLCKRIKDNDIFKKIYFILLSAKGELNDKVEGLELGADEYISKPFEPVELMARVKAAKRIIRLQNELEGESRHFETLAITDELTKLYNRRFFNEVFRKEFTRSTRYQCPLSLILIDIDHFKLFNDKYGHSTGDIVLQTVACTMRGTVRESDIAARYGGEEFIILLPNTGQKSATESAERLRKTIADTRVRIHEELSVTVSLGISFLEKGRYDPVSPDRMLEDADAALLMAKRTGRNKVCYTQEAHTR